MAEWKDVTNCFTEEERHYHGTYMEMNEVVDDSLEVSLFVSDGPMSEVYFSYGSFYGTINVPTKDAGSIREEIKQELMVEYLKNKEPSNEFVDEFVEKYHVQFPLLF